ncbi:caspase family protein [Silanimonas sp.]|uniref:caspase family protein n=1 Tax=Silanimonas sp. TaxID=1929290 RepID=UPI0022BC95CD|nr:caspase family protein [Silanimonas sp.]MCZ8115972.1 caspase family protein [Silanimonas sp.]
MPPTVFSRNVLGAATRALVIGVGHYPSLPGGGGPQMQNPEGLKQLESPPVSAREFAQWLIENYRSDARPLATVQLLLSERHPAAFAYQADGAAVVATPQEANMATVKQAIRGWYELGNHNPDDLMLFYFCGHGVSEGALTALMMSDFGSEPMALMEGALDFHRFHAGMEDCQARHQCYFIDACRLPSTLLRRFDHAGDPVLQPGARPSPDGRVRLGPKFMSTLPGEASHAQPGKPSLFTGALLEALNGAGAGDEDGGDWIVKTNRLHAAMEYLVKEIIAEKGWEVGQQTITDGMQDLPLNTLERPIVPVSLTVTPKEAHIEATWLCTDGNGIDLQRDADLSPWNFRVPVGSYRFQASFSSPQYAQLVRNEIVRPPYVLRSLQVMTA